MSDEQKPLTEAPVEIRNIIKKVIDFEKGNMHLQRVHGIKADLVEIIKKEIQ